MTIKPSMGYLLIREIEPEKTTGRATVVAEPSCCMAVPGGGCMPESKLDLEVVLKQGYGLRATTVSALGVDFLLVSDDDVLAVVHN